ncbi:MAG: glycosyltransferase family 4 protein [Patescibacteria group bacterium]|nr:glycosyltransferase family 4 protein [bacterium]MDZ4240504.1 glycosyltransferase family 4 protein [Patescibacteria group bacterium]
MKLLILTQKVDKNDSMLGFFHRWIEEFSKHSEQLTVVCLQEGEHSLPENTRVFSLGKEKGKSKFKYIFNFYKYIILERKNYDAVFVHMNQEYVLLGWKLWKLMGKKIILWRNHSQGNFLTDMAVFLSNAVCCTSKSSYTVRFKKTKIMPVGIDEEVFKKNPSIQKNNQAILSLGRISPVKKIDVLISALVLLDERGIDFKAAIYGDTPKRDAAYSEQLRKQGKVLLSKNKLEFHEGIPNSKVPDIFNTYGIFVNLTPTGSFDKTILEAMACESLTVFSNNFISDAVFQKTLVKQDDAVSLASILESVLQNGDSGEYEEIRKKGRAYVLSHHTLSRLAQDISALLMP